MANSRSIKTKEARRDNQSRIYFCIEYLRPGKIKDISSQTKSSLEHILDLSKQLKSKWDNAPFEYNEVDKETEKQITEIEDIFYLPENKEILELYKKYTNK